MSALVVPSILTNLFEDTSSGKVVSVIGVGFILALALSFGLSARLGISLMPMDSLAATKAAIQSELTTLSAADTAIAQRIERSSATVSPDAEDLPSPFDAELMAIRATSTVATMKVELERLKTQLTALESVDSGATVLAARSRRDALRSDIERLGIDAAEVERLVVLRAEIATRIETLRSEAKNALNLTQNVEALSANAWSLLILSVLFGVIVGQIARLFFWLSDLPFGTDIAQKSDLRVLLTDAQKLQRQQLVQSKFRYAEAAVNLVIPLLLLGLFLDDYIVAWGLVEAAATASPLGETLGSSAALGSAIAWSFGTASLLLLYSGYRTYRSYRRKERLFFDHALKPAAIARGATSNAGADGTTNPPD